MTVTNTVNPHQVGMELMVQHQQAQAMGHCPCVSNHLNAARLLMTSGLGAARAMVLGSGFAAQEPLGGYA